MANVINTNGKKIDFEAAVNLMDDEIRETLANDGKDGKRQQSEPYQVRSKASKPVTKSARMSKERIAAIEAVFGSFQGFVDNVSLLCITRQHKH